MNTTSHQLMQVQVTGQRDIARRARALAESMFTGLYFACCVLSVLSVLLSGGAIWFPHTALLVLAAVAAASVACLWLIIVLLQPHRMAQRAGVRAYAYAAMTMLPSEHVASLEKLLSIEDAHYTVRA